VNPDSLYADKIAYFNSLAPQWDTVVGTDAERLEKIRAVFSMMPMGDGDTVLDVGCGNGVLFDSILERIGDKGLLYGLDASESMINEAMRLHKGRKNIRYLAGLIEDADLPVLFNAIICFAVFPHIEDKDGAVRRMNTLLCRDGRLYVFHLDDTASLNRFHETLNAPVSRDRMPGKNEIESILERGGFRMTAYIDRPGLNFIEARTC